MSISQNETPSRSESQLPIHTGQGTPGGALLRKYWQPVMLLKDFPADAAPTAIKVMGEDLVLFRDKKGRVGLLVCAAPIVVRT